MRRKIVCSLAGHDKGLYSVVVGENERGLLISDGKYHKLSSPKLKNANHLKETGFCILMEQTKTNKALRKAIFAVMKAYKEEN